MEGRDVGAGGDLFDPASSPVYNVTYVKIYDATPTVVYVGYTPGYQGRDRLQRRRRLRHGLLLRAVDRDRLVRAAGHLRLRRRDRVLAVDGLGLRLRLRLRLGLGPRHGRGRLGMGRLGLGLRVGRLVRRMARRLLRGRMGPARRRGLGPGLRALVHRQRLPLLGSRQRRLALGRRIQRLDRQRLARPVGGGLQLEDGNPRRRPARLRRQRLHRKLCDRRPGRRDEHEDRHDRRGPRRHGRQCLHGQLDLRRPGEGLQPEHGEHHEGRRRHDVERRRRGARRRHGRRQDLERRLLCRQDGTVYKNTGNGWQSNSASGWNSVNDSSKTQQLSKESQARATGEQRYNSFQSNGGASHSPGNWNTGSRSTSMSRPSGGGGRRR